MEKAFILSFFITFVFLVAKIIDMKFVSKEWKPMKIVIRDTVTVLLSSIFSVVVYFITNGRMSDFFNVITENKVLKPSATEVFTGEPGF